MLLSDLFIDKKYCLPNKLDMNYRNIGLKNKRLTNKWYES